MFDVSRFSLKDKVAIITGGGRGIGQAIAFAFAKAGAKVVVTSRKAQDLEATANEIKAFGGEAFPLPAHLGKTEEIKKMIDAVMARYGRIDILVNNAGASPAMASILECDDRLWDKLMDINLKGAYFVSQAAANIMVKQGGGKIINVSSVDGHNPEPGLSIYSISKAGMRMLTKAFAGELLRFNIQVNTISPGPVNTRMMNSHWGHLPPEEAQKVKEMVEKTLPSGRMGEPDEIAGAALYLASDASSYTTGAEILIDGGLLLGNHVS
ncbi:MAG: glucose 1-dehydrogenase [Deltaproteobacteria bacterium]|nr:glucose 1-dehydrogenase [Deltaproteobacteria bacterium]